MTTKDENAAKAFEEGSKLFHDTFKHITTLTTGSIVLVTFVRNYTELQWKVLAVIALAGFVTSTVGAVL